MIRLEEKTESETVATRKSRGISDIAVGRSGIFMIKPEDLRVQPGLNSRLKDFDPEDDDDLALANSVAEYGVRQPLTIHWRDGAPWITDGHRRYGAIMHAIARGAEIASVPVQSEGQYATEADRVFSQIVRNSGKPLQPIEQARVFAKLINLGWDEKSIAAKAGLTRQRVVDLLQLQAGPREVVAMVEAGEVSATLASQTIKAARGDEAAATSKLVSGIAAAKANGKKRATARDLKPKAEVVSVPRDHPTLLEGMRRAAAIVRRGGYADAAKLIEAEMGDG